MGENKNNQYLYAYNPATDQVTGLMSLLANTSSQINLIPETVTQGRIFSTVPIIQNKLFSLPEIGSLLPKLDSLPESPFIGYTREATLSLANLCTTGTLDVLSNTVGAEYKPWFQENLGTVSLAALGVNQGKLDLSSVKMATSLGDTVVSGLSLQAGFLKLQSFLFLLRSRYVKLPCQILGKSLLYLVPYKGK